ncbi:hypothetical protein MLD38_034785 [Melastoma candidum]|uniref:Uncharacterized protein n=1 Tax=Melastoma candidum TaxID=119954 RepID=A0ACB9MCW0_9MYRT|nr:hypothetical protein MLD38_034785 [Melastoma candidum]
MKPKAVTLFLVNLAGHLLEILVTLKSMAMGVIFNESIISCPSYPGFTRRSVLTSTPIRPSSAPSPSSGPSSRPPATPSPPTSPPATRHNRVRVIALGAFLWAAATFLVGISSNFFQVAVSRALNGIGLALVAPAIQSLVADSTDDHNRGSAFRWLQLTGYIGSLVGGLLSVVIAPYSLLGIPGWRISFHLVGMISVLVGVLVRLFASNPRFADGSYKLNRQASSKSLCSEVNYMIQEARMVIKVPSFQNIVAQGVMGLIPWSALSFPAMWLKLTGFSNNMTAFLIALFVISGSLGGLFGGKMGDHLSIRLPDLGRIILSQISSASAVPLAEILLLGLPKNPSVFLYGFILFIMGFFISWNAPATNNPIFAEIVPEKSRASVYALDRSFESVPTSFANPIVGILAQHVYGYKQLSSEGDVAMSRENALFGQGTLF